MACIRMLSSINGRPAIRPLYLRSSSFVFEGRGNAGERSIALLRIVLSIEVKAPLFSKGIVHKRCLSCTRKAMYNGQLRKFLIRFAIDLYFTDTAVPQPPYAPIGLLQQLLLIVPTNQQAWIDG